MNTFEQLTGKIIMRVLLVEIANTDGKFPPLGVFFQLDANAGLLIGQELEYETTAINFMTVDDVRYGFGIDDFETAVRELNPSDKLGALVGEAIRSIRIGAFKQDKYSAQHFIVRHDRYAGAILGIGDKTTLTIFNSGNGLNVLLNSDMLFPSPEIWTLT